MTSIREKAIAAGMEYVDDGRGLRLLGIRAGADAAAQRDAEERVARATGKALSLYAARTIGSDLWLIYRIGGYLYGEEAELPPVDGPRGLEAVVLLDRAALQIAAARGGRGSTYRTRAAALSEAEIVTASSVLRRELDPAEVDDLAIEVKHAAAWE